MLKIGEFSKLSRISVRLLRQFDEIGLLTPETTDPFTGYRYYSEYQLPIANRVMLLKDIGFTHSAIREVLRCYGDSKALEGCLRLKQAEVWESLREAQRRLRLLDTALERLRKDESMMKYDVTIKTLPERYVGSVRQTISGYEREGDLWGVFCEETARMDLQDGEPAFCAAVYHDGEYRETDVDVEIQKTLRGTYTDTEHVKFKTVPAVQVASVTFRGSYDQIGAVNTVIAAWMKDNGYDFAGKSFNIYHVSPRDTMDPDGFLTEVCYPVERK